MIDPRLALARIIVSPREGHEPTAEEHISRAEMNLWELVRLIEGERRDRVKRGEEVSDSPSPEEEAIKITLEDIAAAGSPIPPGEARELLQDIINRRPTTFDTTDLANAKRLVAAHGKNLRYVPEWRGWVAWDGRRWVQDEGRVFEAANSVSSLIVAEAREYLDHEESVKAATKALHDLEAKKGGIPPEEVEAARAALKEAKASAAKSERRRLMDWAKKTETGRHIDTMVARAQSSPTIRAKAEDFDTNPWLLNVQNGTINLETGELRPHRREDLLTKLAPVSYDPDAKAPRFERFVSEIMGGNANLVNYLQRVAGYVLTGAVDERAFIILYGRKGSNGKSLFGEVLASTLGDYATTVPSGVLMTERSGGGKHRATPELAKLKGIRLASASEGQAGQQIDTGQLKEWAGDERLTARELYHRPVTFSPQFKILFRTNFLPKLSPSDHAAWNRIHVVPFTQQFERDPTLKGILLGELPGILAWAARGALEWQVSGLAPPPEVTEEVAKYRMELDVVGRFLEERTREEPGESVAARELYAAYESWCQANHEQPWRPRAFNKDLKDRGYSYGHTETGLAFHGLVFSAHDANQVAAGWRYTTPRPTPSVVGGDEDDI